MKNNSRFPVMLLSAGLLLGGCGAAFAGAGQRPVCAVNHPFEPVAAPAREDRLTALSDSRLPSRYDAREDGAVPSVKNQGELGTCWAFASLQALECALLPEEAWDFSEDHMSSNPSFALNQKAGGDYTMSMAYLLSWMGPVPEALDPYGDGKSLPGLKAVKHVQEIRMLPEGNLQQIKAAVLCSGAVQSALYTQLEGTGSQSDFYNPETGAYWFPEVREPNHDVLIVGWDDEYPRENFSVSPPGDGAFLCLNSWGDQFGAEGYFYVSYFDRNLGKVNLQYTQVEEPDNFDVIYQSDLCGWVGQIGYGQETAWAVNVFTAGETEERLKAVGFYNTMEHTDYQAAVIRQVPEHPEADGYQCFRQIKVDTEGHLDLAGYYTILLAEPVELEAGERFAVAVKLTTENAVHPIAIEYDAGDGRCRIDLSDGEGYVSPDGQVWEQAEALDCNLCLKAYTVQEKRK